VNVVLISTYDLGRQPFGLASPASWLRERGHAVSCVDLSVSPLPAALIRESGAVAFHLPMHTAARLATAVIAKVRDLNAKARLIAYGLYAPPNAAYLKQLGVDAVIGGEFERGLADAVEGTVQPPLVSLERLAFVAPDRFGLPGLEHYSKLHHSNGVRLAGYTEASRGCKHLCRHCPIVPVYQGAFRIVPEEVVMADIRVQVAAGAQHITFGDPDFFNGPGQARRVVQSLHQEFPAVSYDVTIKVEHLLRHAGDLALLRDTGCLFVTSAVESLDDAVLEKLGKGHTRKDFFNVVRLLSDQGLTLSPTFIPFTPWTTRRDYQELLEIIANLGLIDHVAPVQLALRLLIPPESKLLELDDIRSSITGFDPAALLYRWKHADASMDLLAGETLRLVASGQKRGQSRRAVFSAIWELAHGSPPAEEFGLLPRAAIPYLDEPWYC
jgi:radical SAM superfamily enzyme YgiQ (UPF0313 family)